MIKALCYNVYSPRPDEKRAERVLKTVSDRAPDVFCLQEATPVWMEIFTKFFADEYAFCGEGRQDGRDCEYNPVFYKKDRFELLDSKTFWLSDTPEECSKLEVSKYFRICTLAIIKDRNGGEEICAVSAHLDYVWEAADGQVETLLELLRKYGREKTFVCGDFNCNLYSPAYARMKESEFADASTIAKKAVVLPTFTKFGKTEDTIDFAFVKGFDVESFVVDEVKYDGEYPSDHNPIIFEVR